MKRHFLLFLLTIVGLCAAAQNVSISKARFQKGDDLSWAKPETNDAAWSEIDMTKNWDDQGYAINNAYAWYRVYLNIPSSLLKGADQQKIVVFELPKADDADECYLNGMLIGKTGGMSGDKGGYRSAWSLPRHYPVDVKNGGIR